MATFKVLASGNAMVTDYEAMKSNARRYIGRVFDPTLGPAGGWPALKEPQVIPDRPEYRQALREGDLIAADQQTATICKVGFHSPKP